jgi:FkbM family methyltransferase
VGVRSHFDEPLNFMSILKRSLRWSLNALLTRSQRRSLGAFVLNEATGDNDGEAATNGEFALLTHFLKQPHTAPRIAFDVGANVGDWSRIFLKEAAPGDRVFAFEPSADTYERLRANVGGDARLTCVHSALSDHDGEATLHVAGPGLGTNSIHRRELASEQNANNRAELTTEKIRLQTGDAFCSQNKIERIDFLKIDTEGHELAVLKGFARMFSEKRIGMAQFEYGGTWLDARVQLADAFALLEKHSYCIAKIFPAGLKFYDRYDQRLDTFHYANFAAVLPESKCVYTEIK